MALVSSILGRAGIILQDAGTVRWTTSELEGWFNDALRDLIIVEPTAHQKHATLTLVEGVIQTLTAEAVQLVDVLYNVDASDAPARQVRMVDRASLDASFPRWAEESPKEYVTNVMYDPKDRKVFFNYPPATTGCRLRAVYSYLPAAVTATSTVPVDDIYFSPLLDYVLYKAFAKESEQPASAQRAVAHFQAFTQGVQALITYRGGGQPQK